MGKKIIISGFLIGLLLLSLAGCNSSPNSMPLGSKLNPIVLQAEGPPPYPSISYDNHIGKGILYIKTTGLGPTTYAVMLNDLSDNADLYVYTDDTFTNPTDSSILSGTTNELCTEDPNGAGELYIKIDASATVDGTDFLLVVQDT